MPDSPDTCGRKPYPERRSWRGPQSIYFYIYFFTLKRFKAASIWPIKRGHLHPVGSGSLYKQVFANEDFFYMTLHTGRIMEANLSLLLLFPSKVAI